MNAEGSKGRAGASGVALVVVSAVAYGTVPIIATLAFRTGVPLTVFLSCRFTLAALLLWMAVPLTRGAYPRRERVGALLLMGAIGYAGQSAAFFAALQRMPAPATALLLYTYPAIVTLGAAAFFRERIGWRAIGAIVIAFAGTSLVVHGQVGGLNPAGIAFALLSATIYAGYVLFGSKVFDGPAQIASAAMVMSATAVSFAAFGIAGGLTLPSAGAPLFYVVLVAIIGTAIPVVAFLTGMPRVGASRASILSTLEPAVTVVLSGLILAQPLGPLQIAGAICILVSVFVLESGSILTL